MTAPDMPPPARQARSRRTRRVLLDAGFEILERDGLDGLTVAAVSTRAGVSAGTVYRRFRDKEGLLTELQEEFTSGFRDEYRRRMSAQVLPAGAQPGTAVDCAVRALVDTFRANEALLRVFVVLGMRDERVLSTGARASHEGGRLFRDLVWPHRDAFTATDAERAIDVAHRLVYAACMHRVLHGPNMESPTEMSWDELAGELSCSARLYLLGTIQAR